MEQSCAKILTSRGGKDQSERQNLPQDHLALQLYIYIYIYEKMIDKTRHNVMVNMPYRVVKQPRNALKAIWKRKRV